MTNASRMIFSLCAAALLPCAAFAQAGTAPPAAEAQAAAPKTPAELFKMKCAGCHGIDGMAHTKAGKRWRIPSFTTAKWQKEMSDKDIRETIAGGVRQKKTGKVEMPAFNAKLAPEQIDSLVAYVRTFGK